MLLISSKSITIISFSQTQPVFQLQIDIGIASIGTICIIKIGGYDMWLTLFSNTFHLGLLACLAHKLLTKRYAYSIQLITILYLLFFAFVLRYASFTQFDPYIIFILSTLFLLINYKWRWKSHAVLLCFFSLDLLLSAFLVQQLCNPLLAISITQMDRTLFLFFGLIFRCSIALILAYLGLLFYTSYKEALFTKRSGLL